MSDFDKMLRRRLLGLPLGSGYFFQPTPKFFTYMKKNFKNEVVFDVGAGAGQVTRGLLDAKMKAIAIDMCIHAQQVAPILTMDGTDFNYKPGSVVMLCRPCHGSFLDEVIEQAVKCKAAVVLYVGLERNVDLDLGDLNEDGSRGNFKCVAPGVGEDGESIWRMNLQ